MCRLFISGLAPLERHHSLFILETLSLDSARGPHFLWMFNGLTGCAGFGSDRPILHFILRVDHGKTIGNLPTCMENILVCLGMFT